MKMDLREVGCGGIDWIEVAGTCECGYEPSGSRSVESSIPNCKA
jgi:hypothetical protein